MAAYRLTLFLHADEPPSTYRIDAGSAEAALAQARVAIAEAVGWPGEFVLIDRAKGSFMVGAALHSRRGHFRLEREGAPLEPA